MKKKQADKLMNVLFGIAAAFVLTGALFQLQHYAYGKELYQIGIVAGVLTGSIEIARLKKIIKGPEKKVGATK